MKLVGPIEWPIQVNDKSPTSFQLYYAEFGDGRYVIATKGDITDTPTLLRIESSCVFGHILNGVRCDCGDQLYQSLAAIIERGQGMVVYAMDEDARGHGVKLHFELYVYRQHHGQMDERAIFDELDKPLDVRDYGPVIDILEEFGVDSVELMTNNTDRVEVLQEEGIEVTERIPIEAEITEHNHELLLNEKKWMGYQTSYLTHEEWLEQLQESGHEFFVTKNQRTVVAKGDIDEFSTEPLQTFSDDFLTLYVTDRPPAPVEHVTDDVVDRVVSVPTDEPSSTAV